MHELNKQAFTCKNERESAQQVMTKTMKACNNRQSSGVSTSKLYMLIYCQTQW